MGSKAKNRVSSKLDADKKEKEKGLKAVDDKRKKLKDMESEEAFKKAKEFVEKVMTTHYYSEYLRVR